MAPEPAKIQVIEKSGPSVFQHAPDYFKDALEDAERLLKYSAELGIAVTDDVRDAVLRARAVSGRAWDEATIAGLLTALTKLAATLKPMTAESLKACTSGTRPTVNNYWRVAICLAIFIVPFSLASFVGSAISTTARVDIASANDLAVKLRAQLGPPPAALADGTAAVRQPAAPQTATQTATQPGAGPAANEAPVVNPNDPSIIAQLQLYAATIRAIDTRARQLNALVFFAEKDPLAAQRKVPAEIKQALQLPTALPNFAVAANDRTLVYQDVRYFAQSAIDDVSFFYGAISTCVLPALYALLGTCAYLLRTFEQQMAAKTFIPSKANSARFLIAAIGGAVVGLFNNVAIGQTVSIPPLALAFLVGYAVDVFFAFLEGMIQPFTRSNAGVGMPGSGSGAKDRGPS
jgi:hypothetical protein